MIVISFVVGVLGFLGQYFPSRPFLTSQHDSPADHSLDDFIALENVRARQGILDNAGVNGSVFGGQSPGLVIASPSYRHPNCKHLTHSCFLKDGQCYVVWCWLCIAFTFSLMVRSPVIP